ncbi:hypothetical protein [Lactococcus lactis]|uniref:hypothetical protein n=1 Tax=Lactococcus lactis TaxID=1358 RepID=UPI0032E458DC
MSEEEKAKQEVEQVCFAYDKAGDTGDIKDWKCFYNLENKLIEKVKIANQPQLTIPKSIADGLDEEFSDGYKNLIDIFQNGFFISEGVEDWYYGEERETVIVDPNKSTLIVAYLLGKALGVDLVKVVEG